MASSLRTPLVKNRVMASFLAVLRSLSPDRMQRLNGVLLELSEFELIHFKNQPSKCGTGVCPMRSFRAAFNCFRKLRSPVIPFRFCKSSGRSDYTNECPNANEFDNSSYSLHTNSSHELEYFAVVASADYVDCGVNNIFKLPKFARPSTIG